MLFSILYFRDYESEGGKNEETECEGWICKTQSVLAYIKP